MTASQPFLALALAALLGALAITAGDDAWASA